MGFSFGRYLNVRRSERPRLIWLYAMLFASIIGVVWGEAVIEAGFLREVGVQYLPLAIAGGALISMGTISIYNVFADRAANHRLLVAILTACILGIGAGLLLLVNHQVLIAFPVLYILDTVMFRDLLNVHWPIYVNGFYDTQSAKRIFPVLSSATRLAAIFGGLTMPVLNRNLTPAGVISIMLLMQVAMLVLVVLMRRVLRDRTSPALPPQGQGQSNSSFSHIQEGYRFVAGSGFLRWIAAATLLMMILLAFINYETGRLLLENLKTVQNIANFTGLLNAAGNLIALPLQLFFLSRLIARTGVGNAAVIYPSASFLAVTWLAWVPGLFTAGFGYLTRTVLRTTFNVTVDGLLFNAVPLRLKARARGFISGYVMTAGSLAGGLLLLLLTTQSRGILLTVLFSALALAYLVSALQVKRQYGKAVVAMVEHEDLVSLLAPSDTEHATVDHATLGQLAAKMTQPGASPELKVFMAQVICSVGSTEAVQILTDTIRQTGDGHLRARLLGTLAAWLVNPLSAATAFTASLNDPEKEVRQAALAGLERCMGDDPLRLPARVAPLLFDPELQVRASALAALAKHGSITSYPEAVEVLQTLVKSDQPEHRVLGVSILGKIVSNTAAADREALISRFLELICDPDDEVRLAAAHSLEDIGEALPALPGWLGLPVLSALLRDPVERVRCTAVLLLGKGLRPEAVPVLLDALPDPSRAVRSAAIDALVRYGQEVVSQVTPLLESKNTHLRTAAAAVLGRIDPAQFGAVILSRYVTGQLEAAYQTRLTLAAFNGGSASPVLNLLQSALVEQNDRRMDEIFFVLRTILPAGAVDGIASSLRCPDPLKRANALEALEVMTTPRISRLMGPLLEQPPDPKTILAVGNANWGFSIPGREQAIRELMTCTEDPWLSEIAVAAGSSGTNP